MVSRNEYMKLYYQKRKALGLCRICGEKAADGKTLCTFCATRNNMLRRIKRAA